MQNMHYKGLYWRVPYLYQAQLLGVCQIRMSDTDVRYFARLITGCHKMCKEQKAFFVYFNLPYKTLTNMNNNRLFFLLFFGEEK